MKIKKKNLARFASLSALGAGAVGITAKDAHAGIVYTVFSPPNTVGLTEASSVLRSFTVNPIIPGNGGFKLFATSTYTVRTNSRAISSQSFLKVALQGLDGLKFQQAGPGAIWNNGSSGVSYMKLRSKRVTYGYHIATRTYRNYHASNATSTTSTRQVPVPFSRTTYLNNFTGDKYLLFKFNPTGSLDLYGWLHLQGDCGCGLDTTAVEMAFEDSGAQIQSADTGTPEPATALPTSLGALALGATGLRRWRKSRAKAA